MPQCTVLECCFCVPIRWGCIAIGVYNALSSVGKLGGCVFLYTTDAFDAKYKEAVLSVVSVYCVLQLILAFFILLGVLRKVLFFLKWSVAGLIVLAVFSAFIILSFFWVTKKERTFFACCSVDILLYYFALVVYSYYFELKRDMDEDSEED